MSSPNTLYLFTTLLFLAVNGSSAQDFNFQKENVNIIGKGEVEWSPNSVSIEDCLLEVEQGNPENFEITFQAIGQEGENVQIWSGFGFQDRDNWYALGLRGGNNQDLYLCKYQAEAKNKMLALESLDFEVKADEWYKVKIAFWKGKIRVYLNDEKQPRIVTQDEEYLKNGSAVLGGGWLKTAYKDFSIKALSQQDIDFYTEDSIKYFTDATPAEKETVRIAQRKKYAPRKIEKLNEARTKISLNGDWLFLPGYEVKEGEKPYAEETSSSWHVMNVPNFWNPVRNWLHLQDSNFPHRGSGISDNYREKEFARCKAYTFNYTKTKSGWYKQIIELPHKLGTEKWNLHFDAVSKIAEVYVNGQFVGEHIGMFGEFNFDISSYLKAGENTIAVHVIARKEEKAADGDEKVAQAVSVEVTNDMLNSLPHGMFRGDEGGIWQGVKLVVTQPIAIQDVYANTNMDGAELQIEIKNDYSIDKKITIKNRIVDQATGEPFFTLQAIKEDLKAGKATSLNYNTGKLTPKPWSPESPNLYKLITSIYVNEKLVDEIETMIGFRTVEKKGNQFYLNGKPYWLRGANHPPCGIAPNDVKLANTFFKLMHDGNQMVTRSHGSPFTEAWMNAADKQGVGISYEGSWPWLFIGDIPSEELIDVWKMEMLALVKKYRNHPSLLIWTINNEMYFTMFYHNDPPEIRLKKWKIISDLIKEIRKLSPNTLISADSGYSRVQGDYEKNLQPHDIDDGDIDDRHIYNNWYNRDFFQMYNGEWAKRIYWSPGANADRIFFSQETSTGYTNNDDGHYNRKYLFNNYVPQAWVGDWAYENKNPEYTLQRHAFMTKELYETIRRTSPETAGVLLFANVCWFQNVFDAEKISPYPIYDAVKKSAAPILVSAELFGRNFYAGTTINPRVCIVNNAIDGKEIPPATIEWKISHDNQILSSGTQAISPVKHYGRLWQECEIQLPDDLPLPKSSYKLVLQLKTSKEIIAENDYDLLIASKQWVNPTLDSIKKIAVFDLTGETYKVLDSLGIAYHQMKDLTEIRLIDAELLIIANLDADNEVPYNWEDVRKVCNNGKNVLLIHPGKHLKWLFYNEVESMYERTGRIVNMHIPEHGAFDEIDPMELAWWQQNENETPIVCRRSYRLRSMENAIALGTYLRPHTGLGNNKKEYLYEMSGIPLLQIQEDKGVLIASEMETNMATKDPIAAKLLVNLIEVLVE